MRILDCTTSSIFTLCFASLTIQIHAENNELPATTVYADKIHKDWLYTEGSSTQYTADYLANTGINNEHDFIALTGGYLGNPTAGQLSIRGLNNDNVLGYLGTRSNSLISTLTNGVPLSASITRYFPQSLWGLDSASVYLGGQSATYGPNSLGGIIYYQQAKPLMDNSGKLRAEFGTNNTFRALLEQNYKLTDNSAIKLSYKNHTSDGFIENTTLDNDEWAKTNRHTYNLQYLWTSEDQATQLHASMNYDESRSNPFGAVYAFGEFTQNDRKTNENTRTFYPADHWLGTVNLTHQTQNNLTLSNTFGVSTLNMNALIDLDGTPLLPWFVRSHIDENHFSNDLTIKGEYQKHLWLLGLYTQYSDYAVGSIGSGIVGAGIPFSLEAKEEVLINALYAKCDYKINSNWNAIASLRINHEKRDLDTNSQVAINPSVVGSNKTDYTDLLPSLTLAWSPDSEKSAGLKLSRNYRGGGVSYAPSLGLTQEYAPEYSNDIELYFKATPSEMLQWSAALFYSELEDMQVPVSVPMGVPNIDVLVNNSGKGRKYGAEIQAYWEAKDDLFIDFNTTYVHTDFTSLNILGVDYKGSDFPNAPELVSSLGIAYLPENGLYASTRFSWSSSSFTQINSAALTQLEDRSNLTARIGFRKDQWDAYVFANNLLDDDYALGRIDASGLGQGVLAQMNRPRTFGAGLSISW